MLFNSAEFILVFLPITIICFFFLAARLSKQAAIIWLVLASLFFYGWWEPTYLIIILLSMVSNYALGRVIHRSQSKSLLAMAVAANLAVLGYYKYAGFLVWNLSWLTGSNLSIDEIILPLAISFFTFQQIAYLVDSWKGITEEYRFTHYALFVTFFPQLIAGPIVHHKEMLPQFEGSAAFRPNLTHIAVGLSIFAIGLFKKTVIADGIALYANPVFNAADAGSMPDLILAWSGALAYSFQLYFDFSGYSDMALGLARMFGIILPLNFNSPYKACSISEFWRRWHMTLSRFLKDYVYIPLGGNRRGPRLRYLFLIVTMLLGGLWHGAGWSFVIWGGLHGLYLVVNHSWNRITRLLPWLSFPTFVYWLITMLAVIVGWVFFRATSLQGALNILQGMAGLNGIALPNAILVRLGDLGGWLQQMGVSSYHGGGAYLVKAWIGCAVLIPFVICLPNIQDIFGCYKASLSELDGNRKSVFWPGYQLTKAILWQPRRIWAIYSSVLMVLGVMTLGQISDFLYFQF